MQSTSAPHNRRFLIRALRRWYRKHQRSYPWRTTDNPYKILVSEFLLQQTNADLALPTYRAFIRTYPSIQRLAAADLPQLRHLLSNIGLTYRAARMRSTARIIASAFDGEVPQQRRDLLNLPGVGLYMSNAIRTFAFDMPVPILDTNTIRSSNR
jgi:A/G-specific adenine glycosylase